MGTNTTVTLHSHIAGAPFQGRHQHSLGLDVDVYQQPDCAIDRIYIQFDFMATVAKVALRLRVAAVVWAIAWSAAILCRQLSSLGASGESLHHVHRLIRRCCTQRFNHPNHRVAARSTRRIRHMCFRHVCSDPVSICSILFADRSGSLVLCADNYWISGLLVGVDDCDRCLAINRGAAGLQGAGVSREPCVVSLGSLQS